MREILFRGKRTDSRKWIEGYYYTYISCTVGVEHHCHYIKVIPMSYADESESIKVFHETLGQYTGLNDRNGIRIFEGDIFKSPEHVNPSEFTVSWSNGGFFCPVSPYGLDLVHFFPSMGTNIEIIGNIHDDKAMEVDE